MKTHEAVELLTLPKLAAWLATQDPNTTYNYVNNFDCLVCRYLKAHGAYTVQCDSVAVQINRVGGWVEIPHEVIEAALIRNGMPERTYGDALFKARQLLAQG